LFCNIHNTTNDNINVSDLLKRGSGCRQCGRDRQIELTKSKRDVEFENKEIERIKDYVRNGNEFMRNYYKDENYKWLAKKRLRDDTGRFQDALDEISKIQDELGIKKEWWGEKTIKEILRQKEFNGVVSKHKYKECKNSISCRQYEFDVYLPYKLPKLLQDGGVLYALTGTGYWRQRNLPFEAGTAVAYGLTKEQALSMISLNSAKILGIDKTTGSLEKGKDATLFISDGDALDMLGNKVEAAFILGRSINLDNLHKQLYKRYSEKYELK
jgi:hypothetical protein